jgi:hypothetical protein
LLHTGGCHLTAGGLDRRRTRSSPGFRPLQGLHPRWNGPAFTAPPLMRFHDRAANRPAVTPFRVSLPTRSAGPSRDCRPSWGFTPRDLPASAVQLRFGSRLLRAPGCVAVPSSDLL